MTRPIRDSLSFATFLLAGLLHCSSAGAQNLLDPQAWTAWNQAAIGQLVIRSTSIRLQPLSTTPTTCGLEQTVQVPADGLYQFRHSGFGGASGVLRGSWQVGPHSNSGFDGFNRRTTWKLTLTRGSYVVRFTTGTSDLPEDYWLMNQPQLIPISDPTCEIDVVGDETLGPLPSYVVRAPAHFVLLSLRRSASPITVPGILGHLQLDPNSQVFVLGSSPSGQTTVVVSDITLMSLRRLPTHSIQAVRTGSAPEFGTGHTIEALGF